MEKKTKRISWQRLLIASSMIGCVVLGILIGYNYSKRNGLTENELKLNTILNLISQEYVDDSVKINDLTESVIPLFLTGLDPHSSYLSPQENTSEQEELKATQLALVSRFKL